MVAYQNKLRESVRRSITRVLDDTINDECQSKTNEQEEY
jgi:hypothetical protein